MFGRKKIPEHPYLTSVEISRLATYHAERARGLLHTEEWAKEMSYLKERWDKGNTLLFDIDILRSTPPPPHPR